MKVRWGTVVTLLLGAGTAVQLLQQRNAWCLPGGTLGLWLCCAFFALKGRNVQDQV